MKKTLKKIGIYIITAAVFILAGVLYFLLRDNAAPGEPAVFIPEGLSVTFSFEDRADAHSFAGKGFFLTTKDGMTFYTSRGDIRWTDIYPVSLKEPVLQGGGAFAGVSDLGGTRIYMYGETGRLYTENYDERILSFYVSPGGFAVVVRKDEPDYVIHALNAAGEEINAYFSRGQSVYPVSAAISQDGRILAMSLVDISGAVMQSKIMLLYNNLNEKQAFLHGIFYQETMDDELVGKIDFLPTGELVYLSNKRIGVIQTSHERGASPQVLWSRELHNEADAFCVADGNIALGVGRAMPGEDAIPPGTVEIYTGTNGALAGSYIFAEHTAADRLKIYPSGEFITAASHNSYAAFDKRGRLVWEYKTAGEVQKLLILENPDTVLQLSGLEARALKRQK